MQTVFVFLTNPSKMMLWLFRIDFRALNEDPEHVRSLDVRQRVL